MDALEKVLAHYGVKGMRWGVRRRSTSSGPTGHVTIKAIPGHKIKVSGGSGVKISEDAVRAVANRQVAKKSGTHALPNDELKALVTRMQMEQNYKQLLEKQPKSLTTQATDLIISTGQDEVAKLVTGKDTLFLRQILDSGGGRHRKK